MLIRLKRAFIVSTLISLIFTGIIGIAIALIHLINFLYGYNVSDYVCLGLLLYIICFIYSLILDVMIDDD